MVAAACSDGAAPFAPTTESAVLMASRTAAASASKVDVCHVNGTGNYRRINVSSSALLTHLGHGDGLPGEGGFSSTCTVASDPFTFVSVSSVFDEVESLYQIVWTVQGLPSAVSFDVEIFIPPSGPGGTGFWSSQETVVGTGVSSYASLYFYGTGLYRIVATLSDDSVVTSGEISIP